MTPTTQTECAAVRSAREWNARFEVGAPVRFAGSAVVDGRRIRPVDTWTTGKAFAFPGSGPVPEGVYVRIACCKFAVALELVEPIETKDEPRKGGLL